MTQGSITGHLIRFALPMLVGYLFQQLYNTVDLFVVGNYVGDAAYGAVGSVTPIINTLIGFFLGLASGAGVLVSQYFGAGDRENVSKTVHTFMAITWGMSIAFTVVGLGTTPLMLRLMGLTEGPIYEEAKTYLFIYYTGVIGLMIYNTGSGILRSVGDARRPFWFLVITAVLNTLLDLHFAKDLHWGVAGVAWATVIAQCVSGLLVLITLLRAKGTTYRYEWRKTRVDKTILKQIMRIGLPSALQMAITSFSNVFVQGYMVGLGDDILGGWTTYGKVDAFALLPMQSIAMGSTTFLGQNLGAGKLKRAKRGTTVAVIMGLIITALCLLPIMIWTPAIAAVFNKSPGIVEQSVLILRLLSPFYLLCCFNQIYAGALRGAGDSRAPMYIMLGSFVVLRQIYLFIIKRVAYVTTWVVLGYPLGWLACSIACFLYYKFAHWEKHKVTSVQTETENDTE